jgi:hypothetical protein
MDKRSSLELLQIKSKLGNICQKEDLRHCAHNQRSKLDGRLAKNAERALQSVYEREIIWASEQSCFCLKNPEKGGKGTGLGSE